MKNLGQTIKQLREKAEFSLSELSEKSGLSLAYIMKLEKNEFKTLTLKSSKKLSEGFGMTLKEFLEKMGFLYNRETPSFNMISQALRCNGFNPGQIKQLTTYAKFLKGNGMERKP